MQLRLLASMLLVAVTLLTSHSAAGQGRGDFTNFELPRVDPLAIARVDNHDYLLVCNTEDHAVEIWDTTAFVFVARVPVGLGPVSVRWNPKWSRFYTCNMLGDSISVVHLEMRGARLGFDVERTVPVEDEPMDIALFPGGDFVLVTSNTGSSFSLRNALSLGVLAPGFERLLLSDSWADPKRALKEPRRIFMSGLKLFVVGHRGTRVDGPAGMDVWSFDFLTGTKVFHDRLGSSNFAATMSQNGNLFVASGTGQIALPGEAAVRAAPTGFVRSLLHRIDFPGTPYARTKTRDLHVDFSTGQPRVAAKDDSLAHPHAIALLEEGGTVRKVFLAGYNSDRIGIVTDPLDDDSSKWKIRTLVVPRHPGSTARLAGPRGLVMKAANAADPRDPGQRLYVLNALDSSLVAIDPVAETVVRVRALRRDPVPAYIKTGRELLYSAKISGNGFVSCASCHVDGRLDGLLWNLGSTTKTDRFDPSLVDGNPDPKIKAVEASGFFPPGKGFLMTQSLQGLAQFEVNAAAQRMLSAGPFHWRGDRPNLQSFAGAFESLLGGSKLSAAESAAMEEHLLSIHYPPNPRQPKDRVPSGSLGAADDPDQGTGAKRGMKLYHIAPLDVCQQRSCVHCHTLPTGSNSRITESLFLTGPLRGPMSRERVLELTNINAFPSSIRTQEFGVAHNGFVDSTSAFNRIFFNEFPTDVTKAIDINRFNLEFDSGVAPMVGLSATVRLPSRNASWVPGWLSANEGQVAEVNVGLAVQASLNGRLSGWIYDVSANPARYVRVDGPGSVSRSELLAMLATAEDRLHFICTPLGEARRVAAPSGTHSHVSGPAPSLVKLEPLRTNTFHADVPSFTKNWKPKRLGGDFDWTARFPDRTPVPEPRSVKSIRLMQWGLIRDGVGLTELRHDAPRRLCVSGRNIRHGAKLQLFVPDGASPPPYANLSANTIMLEVPIYPSARTTSTGERIWESAAELSPRIYYSWILGGAKAPGVAAALEGSLDEPPLPGTFDPARWNRHLVVVRNEDDTYVTAGLQALRLDP